MSDTIEAGCDTVVFRSAASTTVFRSAASTTVFRSAASTVTTCVVDLDLTPPVATFIYYVDDAQMVYADDTAMEYA